eukprot:CAMPEP_0117527950 /NCGR_PEP_ID=MMETSP0784-20121206/37063_1 /TAXON_ID=39447 /ORGANISM="" /LENGTH=298 /DNA_ID=CAMNT_0005324221 /DNA_START=46 /DNA_END=939 /DNA_ORIENTATION=-
MAKVKAADPVARPKKGKKRRQALEGDHEAEAKVTEALDARPKKRRGGKKVLEDHDEAEAKVTEAEDARPKKRRESKKIKKRVSELEVSDGRAPSKKARIEKGDELVIKNEDMRPNKPKFEPSPFRLFLSGLPKTCDEETLRKDFEECGEITNLKLLLDRDTGESKGLAFISYKDEDGFNAALEYNGYDYGGRRLKVQKAAEKGNGGAATDLGPKPAGCNSIVVKRLAPEVTNKDLERLFAVCGGGPRRVGLLTDKAGVSRCTARVDFKDGAAVDEAVKLAGTDLKGRPLVMSYCKPRE